MADQPTPDYDDTNPETIAEFQMQRRQDGLDLLGRYVINHPEYAVREDDEALAADAICAILHAHGSPVVLGAVDRVLRSVGARMRLELTDPNPLPPTTVSPEELRRGHSLWDARDGLYSGIDPVAPDGACGLAYRASSGVLMASAYPNPPLAKHTSAGGNTTWIATAGGIATATAQPDGAPEPADRAAAGRTHSYFLGLPPDALVVFDTHARRED